MSYIDRVYGRRLPTYSDIEKNRISISEYRAIHTVFLDRVNNTTIKNGKIKIIRELFEHILSYGENFIVTSQKYRRTTIDKCTEMIEDINSRDCIHPKDKQGLTNLFAAVQRMCLKYE